MALLTRGAQSDRADPVAHLMRLISMASGRSPRGIAMVWAYFDETVVQSTKTLMVGGCVAPLTKWETFAREWIKALNDEQVSEFHAKEFHTFKGEFGWKTKAGTPAVKRHSAFDKRLSAIITENVDGAFSFSVPIAQKKGEKAEQSAYRLAIDDAFREMLRELFWGKFKIEFFIVARRSGVDPLTILENFQRHKLLDHMSGCGVFPPKEVVGLQAADYVLHALNRKEQGRENNPSLGFLRKGFAKFNKPFLTKITTSSLATSDWNSGRGRPS